MTKTTGLNAVWKDNLNTTSNVILTYVIMQKSSNTFIEK